MAQQKDAKTGKWMYYGSYVNKVGKRVQYKKRGFDTKKEAIRAEIDFMDKINNLPSYILFKEVCDEFIVTLQKDLKESSLLDTKSVLSRINKSIGDIPLSKLNEHELQKYIDELDENYSKLYVEKLYYRINKVLNYAVMQNYIVSNPLKKVKRDSRKNETKTEMNFWEPTDFHKFIVNVDDQMYKNLFSFLYYMGTRKGEALALTWKDINFKTNTVRIDKMSNAKLNNKITSPKTSNSYRTITMPNHLSEMLLDWKKHQQLLYEFSEERFVFGYYRIIPSESMRRYFKMCIEKTNSNLNIDEKIPNIRIHDLRHSHASYLINNMSAGFTDFDIAKRLGDTVSTLHNTYAHWFKTADKNIIDFMNNDNN